MTYFKENGGLFTFITGRGPVAATELCTRLQLNAPIGCCNGGGIYDHQKGKLLWMATLDTAAMEMLDAVDAGMPDIAIQVNTADEAYFCKYNKALEHFRAVSNLPDRPVRYRGIEEPIGKVILPIMRMPASRH